MGIFHRRKRPTYTPPPPPCPHELERTAERLHEAEEELRRAERRDPEVEERGKHMDHIRKVNKIGPKFWAAVSMRKGEHA